MSRRYSFESSEDPYSANPPQEGARHQQPYQEPPQRQYEQPYQQQYQQPYQQSYQQPYQQPHQQPYQQPSHQSSEPLSQQPREQSYQQSYQQPYQQPAVNNPAYPGAHPDSAFDRLRAVRRQSQSDNGNIPLQTYPQPINTENPPAPVHRDPQGRYWGQELGYSNSMASNTTPGADNFSEQAGGGIAGIALGVADAHARESGLEALRHTPGYEQPYDGPGARDHVAAPGLDLHDIPSFGAYESLRPTSRIENSQTSLAPLNPAAMPPLSRSPHSFQGSNYSDTPYNRLSRNLDPNMGGIDPNSIEDDGDDGLEYTHHNRGSIQNLTSNAERSNAAPVAAAAAGGVMGTLGGLVGRSVSGNSQYGPVSNPQTGYGDSAYNLSREAEKSEWLKSQSSSRKKWKWIIATTAIFLVVAGIVAGVTVPLLMKKNSSSSDSSSDSSGTASGDTTANGDLGTNSAEIQALLNNKDLHKIFPGIDYSPINTQYPDCLSNPPSQNNVTRDLAVLSQLTNVIRLYGTDCNQTQMLLHSIDRLGLNDTVKVWLGVYQDKNATTNARQLSQMYDILNTYGASPFLGIIIGNEVLFNQYMTEVALETIITGVRTNLTSMGINLPVATSDLGDNWTATLANAVDYVMANVHPFFAGVESSVAASWTWSFWQDKDAAFKTDPTKSIISETGWPSQGGTDCGAATTCTTGSVASIDDMNTFMSTWVCQALANGTNYFWFEAFDEPWKLQYDTAGKEWEDHWGLMDVNRNLKNGVKIPDCGGKTVGPASA